LKDQVDSKIRELQAPKFLEIAKNMDGSPNSMTYVQAIKYCSENGAHLSKARELAQFGVINRAKGISRDELLKVVVGLGLRSDEAYKAIKLTGYSTVNAKQLNEPLDVFLYSDEGFIRPLKWQLGSNFLWSSSLVGSDDSPNAWGLGYWGGFEPVAHDQKGGVLCVEGLE
jgi:hypothetical protein